MRKTTSLMLSFGLAAGLTLPLTATASVTPDAGARAETAQGQKPKPAKPAKPAKPEKTKDAKPDKPAAQQSAQRRNDDRPDRVRVIDRDGHVRVIRDYSRAGLPPGLAKREQLPPGLRKQIREKGTLPPGLQKRLVPVPASWSNLPPIGQYERRYFAGDDLIIIDTRTNRIVAYIVDILR